MTLREEQETLLIPLWGKAVEGRRGDPILVDPKAAEVLSRIDYDFSRLAVPRKTSVMMALRAKKLDDLLGAFLAEHPGGLVLHLGCGLDSRCERVPHPAARWVDLDLPDVIALRRELFEASGRDRMIAASVTEEGWPPTVEPGGPAMAIAEGLLMYLREEEVRGLLLRLHERWPGLRVAFDAFSSLTVRSVSRHRSLRRTGATVRWGLDDPGTVEAWVPGARLREEWAFADSAELGKLGPLDRALYRLSGRLAVVRRAHRILVYDL